MRLQCETCGRVLLIAGDKLVHQVRAANYTRAASHIYYWRRLHGPKLFAGGNSSRGFYSRDQMFSAKLIRSFS